MEYGVSLSRMYNSHKGKLTNEIFNDIILKRIIVIGRKFEEKKVLHFDYKPDNFVLIASKYLKIVDFGLSE